MTIKINVTGEMIKNAQDLAPCPLTHEEMRKMLGAAVRIVERDLNASASPQHCRGVHMVDLDVRRKGSCLDYERNYGEWD